MLLLQILGPKNNLVDFSSFRYICPYSVLNLFNHFRTRVYIHLTGCHCFYLQKKWSDYKLQIQEHHQQEILAGTFSKHSVHSSN